MAICAFHRDHPGIGVCVRCRTVVCADCCTRLDGINHCPECLAELAERAEPRPAGGALAVLAAVVLLGFCWLFFFGLCWLAGGRLSPGH